MLKLLGIKTAYPVILCYHAVEKSKYEFAINPKSFKDQIDFLRKNRNVVSVSNLLAHDNKNNYNKVAITFDDGYQSVLFNAAPLLKKYSLPATFFLLGNVSQVRKDELENNLKLLTNNEAKKLLTKEFEIGSHTISHPDLSKLSNSEIAQEIIESKKMLEKRLAKKIKYIAYPKGIYNKEVIKAVKKAGYKAAFTVESKNFNYEEQSYKIPRYCVGNSTNLRTFEAILTPIGLKFADLMYRLYKFNDTRTDFLH